VEAHSPHPAQSVMSPHLLVALSAHGLGHLAQTAPVLNALRQRLPGLRLTLQTALSRELLAARIAGDFTLLSIPQDIGMLMRSAVDVDVAVSCKAYRRFHEDWQRRVSIEAQRLADLAPDLVLANIPYLALAAAKEVRIPSIALCSLNWADIYQHYCGARAEAARIHGQMLAAYASAQLFLQPAPSMPMADLTHRRPIGPIAARTQSRRALIDDVLGIGPREQLVLIALGGVAMRLPVEHWPQLPGVRWVVPQEWAVTRREVVIIESVGLSFAEVFSSCDVVVTKPGYGSFVEAACHGLPVLYVHREDWPESAYLEAWLRRYGRCLAISRTALEQGRLEEPLRFLAHSPAPEPLTPSGVREAAEPIAGLLQRKG
jgi:hypothetical protein